MFHRFQKSIFDKVSHSILLWQKLIHYGIEGKFLTIIKYIMYSKVRSCVRSNKGLTELFLYQRGLRQGCPLSLLLFTLFISKFIRYAQCCSHYDDFRCRHECLVDRLLSQGCIALRLEKSFKKFYGRYQDLIEKYQRSVNIMVFYRIIFI